MPDQPAGLLPLSMLLYPDYGMSEVIGSQRRVAAGTAARQAQKEPLKKNPTIIGIEVTAKRQS